MRSLSAKILLSFLASLAAAPALQAEESLNCDLARPGAEQFTFESRIVEKQAVVQDTRNPLALRIDASLAPSSFLFVMQDDAKSQRLAFTGAPTSLMWSGGRLSSGSARLGCQKRSTEPATFVRTPKVEADQLVCLLDEAIFENGQLTKATRVLQTVSSTITFRMPLEVKAENAQYSIAVRSYDFDPANGLRIQLTDKSNGESAQYAGPPRSLVSSVMLGFTQGNKETSAKFLRLGCVLTSEPAKFLEAEKKKSSLADELAAAAQ